MQRRRGWQIDTHHIWGAVTTSNRDIHALKYPKQSQSNNKMNELEEHYIIHQRETFHSAAIGIEEH